MRVDREGLPPRRPRIRDTGERIISLQELRDEDVWWWFYCRNPDCFSGRPAAIVPFIIRLGRLYPVSELKRNMRCEMCGHRGFSIGRRSWHDISVGLQPWPDRFYADASGIVREKPRTVWPKGSWRAPDR